MRRPIWKIYYRAKSHCTRKMDIRISIPQSISVTSYKLISTFRRLPAFHFDRVIIFRYNKALEESNSNQQTHVMLRDQSCIKNNGSSNVTTFTKYNQNSSLLLDESK